MAPTHALFPGSFDPPTLGHLDLLRRSRALFDRVTVALAIHPQKRSLFDAEEREALWRASLGADAGVQVTRLEGLVVEACRALGCNAIVRGVRSGTDLDYEVSMAGTNRAMHPGVDTVLLVPSPELSHISSTLVRQIAGMGGEVDAFVPPPVAAALRQRFRPDSEKHD